MTEKHSLLIIDDEEDIGEILGVFLEEDFACEWVDNPNEGIERAKKKPFSIIITDLEMPDIDGLTVIKEIRASGIDSVIIVSTGHDSSNPKVVSAMEAGAQGLLCKPFMDPVSVVKEIKKYLV